MAQPMVAVIINGMVGKAVQGAGHQDVQKRNAQGEVILHIQRMQTADNPN